ncbi:MAG: hypothetical protein LBS81_01480 [Endomicrobium sp.]|jgi:nicotinamide-nucleotide amidase|nr:hypothetical protein [Endomicrobium sp.]
MKIELICTGSELLAEKVNTNAAYIGSRFSAVGLVIRNRIYAGIKKAFKRSDVIIVTGGGGLGPTFDDITVETAANV